MIQPEDTARGINTAKNPKKVQLWYTTKQQKGSRTVGLYQLWMGSSKRDYTISVATHNIGSYSIYFFLHCGLASNKIKLALWPFKKQDDINSRHSFHPKVHLLRIMIF